MPQASTRRSILIGFAALLAAGLLLALILWPRRSEIAQALESAPIIDLLLIASLLIPALFCRLEAWRLIVQEAQGQKIERRPVFVSSLVGMAVNNLNIVLGFSAQIALLRRLAPERSPSAAQLAATAGPLLWIEGSLALILLCLAATTLEIPVLALIGLAALAVVGFCLMLRLERRSERLLAMRGLAALRKPRLLALVGGLMAANFTIQLLRLGLALNAVGLEAQPFMVVAAFVAIGLLGLLPIGMLSGPGALVAIFGAQNLALAGAAGLVFSVTGALTVIALSLLCLPLIISESRKQEQVSSPVS